MLRLARSFVTLWIVLYLPSFIIWGLLVRASDGGTRRFLSTWQWLEDKLAYPLLFSPLTDPAWTWFRSGSAVSAVVGFILLIAIWAMIFTLPVIFVAGWWMVIVRLLGGRRDSSAAYPSGSELGVVSHYPPSSSLHAPSGAIYLITIPLALVWNALRFLTRPFHREGISGRSHPIAGFLWPVAVCLLVVFVVQMTYFGIAFAFAPGDEWRDTLRMLYRDDWYSHLDTMRIPRLFETQFTISRFTILDADRNMTYAEWESYLSSWYRQPELRVVTMVIALRQALLVAAAFLVFWSIRRVLK